MSMVNNYGFDFYASGMIITAGHDLVYPYFNCNTGIYNFQDALTASNTIYINSGSVNFNGAVTTPLFINAGTINLYNSLTANAIQIDESGRANFGSSIITISERFKADYRAVINAGTSTIKLTGDNSVLATCLHNLYRVEIYGNNVTIEAENTYHELYIIPREDLTSQTVYFGSEWWHKPEYFYANGSESQQIRLLATISGKQWFLYNPTNNITVNNVYIQDCNAQGLKFSAINCIDGGNNVGWNFTISSLGMYCNIDGIWKTADSIFVNIDGLWKRFNSIDINVNSTWKSI
jgi:hypothetical protein